MTTPIAPANGSEPMTLEEIRALLEQTAKVASENTQAIIEMRATRKERDARHDREMEEMRAANAERDARFDREMEERRVANAARDARFDREMEEMRAANAERDVRRDREIAAIQALQTQNAEGIAKLMEAQHRTSQEVSTLKGWGLELYCERNPDIFAVALGLKDEDLIPKREIRRITDEARTAGFITLDQWRHLTRADVFIYARRIADSQPVCLVVEASYQVQDEDVYRAADRAEILRQVIQQYQPRYLNGQAMAVVAGTDITDGAQLCTQTYNVAYVPVKDGNRLTSPPE